MPGSEELPDELQPLLRRNAIEISDTRWDYDVSRLGDTLAKHIGLTESVPSTSPVAPPVPDAAVAEKKGGGLLGKVGIALGGAVALVVALSFVPDDPAPDEHAASSPPPADVSSSVSSVASDETSSPLVRSRDGL